MNRDMLNRTYITKLDFFLWQSNMAFSGRVSFLQMQSLSSSSSPLLGASLRLLFPIRWQYVVQEATAQE